MFRLSLSRPFLIAFLSILILKLDGPSAGAALIHRYSFSETLGTSVADSAGGSSWNGTLMGGASLSAGAVVLDGSSGYVDLPNGIVSTLSNATFEVWVTDNGSGNWARIIDFGFSTGGEDNTGTGTNYLFLCPNTGGGITRAALIVNRLGGEQFVEWGTRLPTGAMKHIVWTIDSLSQVSRLYVDGSLVGENTAMTINPSLLGVTVNNWLGRSQFTWDSYFNGSISEFRIYDEALTAETVSEDYTWGPDVAASGPVSIIVQPQNQSVVETRPANFSIGYGGSRPVQIQWFCNNVAIPGATNDTYTLPFAALTNNGNVFRAALTNTFNSTVYSVTTSNAVLTVTADTTAPVLVRAASLYPNEVLVTFTEGLLASTATNTANYAIPRTGGSLAVTAARFGNTVSNILLTTSVQSLGTNYTLTVNNVRDLSVAANRIATNSQTTFCASLYQNADIGNPASSGLFTPNNGGYSITAGGTGISGAADQFTFGYQSRTNDFDVQVRVAALNFSGAWARAGLMARDGLTTNAVFAACFATPGPAGCHFESRSSAGASTVLAGAYPVNYPDTWLRLRRVGDVFDGFASLDGQTWDYLGSASITMSAEVEVGFAVTAASASGTTTARFENDSAGSGSIVTNSTLPFEPPGPCSRRTALVISEIMYNPPDAWGTNNLEFIELWNSGLVTEDLTGYKLTGEISYQFPNGTALAPGQFLVVAKEPAAAQSFYGVACLGPYANKLSNSGGTLRLRNELGGILLEIEYNNKMPWPVAADGAGHSLVLSRPSYGQNDPRAWSASDVKGGSPGTFEHRGVEPARSVMFNEVMAHTDPPQVDTLELFNSGTQAVNLSGAWLSDDPSTNKFRIPDGTLLPARGFLSYTSTQLGFALAAEGQTLLLVNSNKTRVLEAINFPGQANGVSSGHYPDGAPNWQELSSLSFGTTNAAPLFRPVVINEIMYNPISGTNDDEYIELYNRASTNISLGGWKIQGSVGFTFPSNVVINAGACLVVAENITNLLSKYSQLNLTNTYGNYSGSLPNGGGRIVLSMPEDLIATNKQGAWETNYYQIPVDEVAYLDGGRWGRWSDGGGSSLELTDPHSDNRSGENWADSDESGKAAWTTIDVTDVLENGMSAATVDEGTTSYGVANRLEFFMQGAGDALIDNLAFLNNGGSTLIANGDFESGTNGWTFGGVMRQSGITNGAGVGGSKALLMVSADRGDTGPNKVFRALTTTATTGAPNTGTIRASVRWLRGSPWILLRVRGNWMEVSQRLNVPSNCGTPGLPNSSLVSNAGPVITDVTPNPILPAAGQPVVITARVQDPDGITAMTVRYRVDPAMSYTILTLRDNGTGGDAVAGDGIFSATIPGQAAGTLAAFYLSATDAASPTATRFFPAESPRRECHIRWGETVYAGSIGTYRLWLTASNITFWTSRERNANDPLDATFVYGNSRVCYNVDTMYSGSPFHTPAYNGPLNAIATDYEINFHPGDLFLGSEPFVLTAFDVADGNFFFNDDSAQVDLTGTWVARKLGQQYNYRRHVHVVMNGVHRGTIYDDTQQPNGDMLEEYYPDDSGRQLRKIESWFEFADNGSDLGSVYATLTRVSKSAGEVDSKVYRWNWRPRATDEPNDWSAFTNLVVAVNDFTSPNYEARVRNWMDVRNFLRPIVAHHVCGSWDSYAYGRGKNMYAFCSDDRPWRLLMWDIEISLGAGGDGPTTSIYTMFDPTLLKMITNVPAFHREYLGAVQEAVQTAFAPGAADVLLDERYASFQQNNLPLVSPAFIKTWIAQRRTYLLTVLPSASFALAGSTNLSLSGSNLVTLTGTAPLNLDVILVNSNAYAIRWTSLTNWSVTVPLAAGTNVLNITAKDRSGALITNATGTVTANFTSPVVLPEGWVVFNELQMNPAVEGAGFVELFNTHSNQTFDLSNWRINGLGYTFPPGSTLGPRGYLVLAENSFLYSQTYGLTNVPFGVYDGTLDPEGETLTLFRPGATNEIVVDRVRYEATAPWMTATNGISLQLVDAAQDNVRVANWGIETDTNVIAAIPSTNITLINYTNVWKYMQVSNLNGMNWTATNFNDSSWPSGSGLLAYENNSAINSLIKTTLNDPRTATGTVSAGHAYYFRLALKLTNKPADFTFSASAYIDDGMVLYINGNEITRIRMNAGTVLNTTLANATPSGSGGDTTSPDVFTIPASAFVTGTNTIAVSIHQSTTRSTDIVFGLKLDATNSGTAGSVVAYSTPGTANSVATNLPSFPPVWLNELQADNVTGPLDNYSQRDPWAELHNTSATNFNLAGYYLSDTYTNLVKWAFPTNATIPARGFLMVWCDNQTNQMATNSIHSNFRLTSGSGALVLSRLISNTVQVVDFLNYTNLQANRSYGDVPDGEPFYRNAMFHFTPGASNNGASAPITVFINEWMADNASTLTDPADSSYEDWFELYNPGTNAVDVGGYYLTDNLTNKFQFKIPTTGRYVVPARGHLLVWADNESGQNSTNRSDLHVNFALAKGGEALGLFAADGSPIDSVTFGAQTTDVSQGRYQDGAASIYSMSVPTPRAANYMPNTAPVLAIITNRVVTLGQTVSFIASATDADLPAQTLAFSLYGAPSGATINPFTGQFTWTPSAAPSTNTIRVVVSDNGTPSLSATQSVTIAVAPLPSVACSSPAADEVAFRWIGYPGMAYQVEYKGSLNDSTWVPASAILYGTGAPLAYTNLLDGEVDHGFYRVRVLP